MKPKHTIWILPILAGLLGLLALPHWTRPETGTTVCVPEASPDPVFPRERLPEAAPFESIRTGPEPAPVTPAETPEAESGPHPGQYILEDMPRRFVGNYRWDGSDSSDHVLMYITDLSIYDNETVTFCGSTNYDHGDLIVHINGDINVFTLEVEFGEYNEDGDGETDGTFKGYVSPDLKLIYARWVPFHENANSGTLAATADDSDPQSPNLPDEISLHPRTR